MAKWSVWLAGLLPDDIAEQILQEVGGIAISDTSIWRRVAVWGERFKALEAAQAAAARALPEAGALIRGVTQSGPRMGVAMDGAMVNIRDEGFKEFKAACVFEVERQVETEPEASEPVERVRAVHNSYVAVLGGPEPLGTQAWAEASRRRWAQALDTIVLGDGAPWIWNLARHHFSMSQQAVDWYHAKQHLYAAAYLAYGEGSAPAMQWARRMEDRLYRGEAWAIANAISDLADKRSGEQSAALRTKAGYFDRNQRRMLYAELREEGWPIGSGMIESGCKQFAARLTGPGMRWSRQGAERMIPIRATILSKRFDEVWANCYNLPTN